MKIFGGGGVEGGCFVRFDMNLSKSQGAVLSVPTEGGNIVLPTITNGSKYLGAVITGVIFRKQENMSNQKCFNERVYTYTFGEDIGEVQIQFTVFLTTGVVNSGGGTSATGGQSSDILKELLEVYEKGRISQSKKQAVLTLGANGKVLKGQIYMASSNTLNSLANTQQFTLSMRIVPEPPKKASKSSSSGGGNLTAPRTAAPSVQNSTLIFDPNGNPLSVTGLGVLGGLFGIGGL